MGGTHGVLCSTGLVQLGRGLTLSSGHHTVLVKFDDKSCKLTFLHRLARLGSTWLLRVLDSHLLEPIFCSQQIPGTHIPMHADAAPISRTRPFMVNQNPFSEVTIHCRQWTRSQR